MSATTRLYDQVLSLMRRYGHRRDLRHLKALAWMVTALLCSGQLRLPKPTVTTIDETAKPVPTLPTATLGGCLKMWQSVSYLPPCNQV